MHRAFISGLCPVPQMRVCIPTLTLVAIGASVPCTKYPCCSGFQARGSLTFLALVVGWSRVKSWLISHARGDVGQFGGWFNGLLKTFQNCLSGTDKELE